ncbi:uncharacterized protein LOC118200925 [Stegodyphus dumicola]|uniref:uncharacterized protein LOC118200925 n=1 Tax=Stegodyphus dumicola TaxID=202533 RepID=UPI0015AE63BF|nr:uncharacterized protein LOC118200925 [Stegodyphus dumicola]XP_035228807.1 uncharacterized protein LOC118200925 [Stegodyphus dumicola]XP_035228808.1 uncharacterized protein LOC118200925 [Stegodyphus dumicola]
MNRRLSEEELFKRLKSNDVSIIYSALANIANYYGRNCEAMKVLEKYSAIENIISYLEHPKLSSFSVSIIADACLESSLVQEIIKNNAVTVLIRIMKSTVTDQIRSRACRALGNIALSELGFTSIPGQEIVPILVRFLTETVDVNHQQIALRTLRILGKSSKNRVIIVRAKALTSIVSLLHSSHKKVLLSSIKTLSELSANCNKELGNQLINLEVHTILVELYSQAESPAQKCALTTLKNMSYCHEIKNILVKAGVLNTFVEAANNLQDFEISSIAILALCKFLDRVFAFNIEEKNAILKVLIDVLQLNTYKTIHAHIISALFPLSFTPEMTEVLQDYKIVTVLIRLLKYFINFNKFKHVNPEPTICVDNCNSVINYASSFSNLKEGFKKLPSSFPSVLENIPNPEGNAECSKESHFRVDKGPVAGKSLNRKSESNVVSLIDNSESFDKSRTEYSVLSAYDEFAKSEQISSLKLSDSLEQLGKHNIDEENCKLSMLNTECSTSSDHEKKRKAEHLKESTHEFSTHVANGEHKRIKTSEKISVLEEKVKISKTEHLRKADVSDHHILRFLLQIASHNEIRACLDFTNKANFIVLLDYIFLIPNPDSKALKCLSKVAENVNCFEKLIINGFFMAIEENFKKMHDFKICYHCSQVNAIFNHIYLSASTVAESNYGIGILHKLLSSSEKQNQLNALHIISRVVKNMSSGLKLLILGNGLSLLTEFLNDTSKSIKIGAFLCLCELYKKAEPIKSLKETHQIIKGSFSSITHSEPCFKCAYENALQDVTFALDSGEKISASRKDLSQNSEYFDALLNGHFLERSENLIILPDISVKTLTIILHFLHGCQVQYCRNIQMISLDVLLELLSSCERLLLTDIKAFTEKLLLEYMHPNTIFNIYSQAKLYNSFILVAKAVDYVLSIHTFQQNNLLRYFEEFMNSPSYFSFIDDIKRMTENKFKDWLLSS